MPEYRFTVTAHDAAKPWLIVGVEHLSATLAEGESFFEWAGARWPADRFTVELEPWQLSPRTIRPAGG